MSVSTLTEWLRERDDAALARLLGARPDLATPIPADTSVLATRAGSRASVARAAESLDTFTLAVLDALLLCDADTRTVALADVATMLGTKVPRKRVREAVDTLVDLALAWGPDNALSVVPSAREAAGMFPGGLGRRSAGLDGNDLAPVLAELSEPERRLLATLAEGQPTGRSRDANSLVPLEQAQTPVQKLLARGLLLRLDAETVELPRQVGLALRGANPMGQVKVNPPPVQTTAHTLSTVDSTAAGEAMELIRHTEELITLWSADPPPVLRAGGLGVRDIRKLARELRADEVRCTLIAELAFGAGLVVATDTTSPQWAPTTQADIWLAATPPHRWATLASVWLDLPRLPGLAGSKDLRDKVIAPLSEELRRPLAPTARRRVLDALAEFEPGTGVDSVEELAGLLAWRAPRRGGRLRDELVFWTVREAQALGLVAFGTLTTSARALLEDGPAVAAKRMAEAMPTPVDHVLVQADLTVVAPGPLEQSLGHEINLVADVESAGGATVYRVSETSVRRALDAGRTSTDLHELFRKRSRTPVPQALTYMIDDVARRHGQLRGGAAMSFLRCDDEALLTEVAASSVGTRLELRKIAPGVLVSPVPLADVLEELRAAGFAPSAEDAEGRLMDMRSSGLRVPLRQRPKTSGLPRPASPEQLADLVSSMRAGDKAAGTRRGRTVALAGGRGADTSETLALLQEAVTNGRNVYIGYVDAHGTASQRVIEPVRVGAGVLEGLDSTRSETHRFALHRITSVSLVED
ncbi:DNA-binding protein [Actinosynnema sp. ALI-1.44]|uniref:helicase-associated domain-containing protein n=1 Tax=Actinosynnema sp. ALI-1.44 TaxID=1933779 RepID=UPI00097BEB1D|nr:helicase-associated domain-containing protein [Actinosynnema sp. ALI-1.44]ONI78997.1 DNA-binding protein [Actinosynnema sp. ALI-1.44]